MTQSRQARQEVRAILSRAMGPHHSTDGLEAATDEVMVVVEEARKQGIERGQMVMTADLTP